MSTSSNVLYNAWTMSAVLRGRIDIYYATDTSHPSFNALLTDERPVKSHPLGYTIFGENDRSALGSCFTTVEPPELQGIIGFTPYVLLIDQRERTELLAFGTLSSLANHLGCFAVLRYQCRTNSSGQTVYGGVIEIWQCR